jgi:hypothetical protein
VLPDTEPKPGSRPAFAQNRLSGERCAGQMQKKHHLLARLKKTADIAVIVAATVNYFSIRTILPMKQKPLFISCS